MRLKPLSEEEINKIAMDAIGNLIFLTNDPSIIRISFPVILLSRELPTNIGAVWEYYKNAGPRSVNGYPQFFSCNMIAVKSVPLLRSKMEAIKKAIDLACSTGKKTSEASQ